jgi:hypothetical protein
MRDRGHTIEGCVQEYIIECHGEEGKKGKSKPRYLNPLASQCIHESMGT